MHFFDFRSQPHTFLDCHGFQCLSFFVRGDRGGESFLIRAFDRELFRKESSVSAGPVERYLPNGVTTEWQEVVVPLTAFHSVDMTDMAGLTLEFTAPGQHVIYIDDVSVKSTPEVTVPLSRALPRTTQHSRPLSRSLWIWNTERIIPSVREVRGLIQFARAHHIDCLWSQLPHTLHIAREDESAADCSISMKPELRRFLRMTHAAGLSVHALDGAPENVATNEVNTPLAVVEAVVAFNHEAAPEERFDGVHFDNEPYLLPQWVSPPHREELLLTFLRINAACQARCRAAGIQYGVDIPFWWDQPDERSGQPIGDVTFRGVRKPASHHCIDMLDNVGVMNYRNSADGADGMIAHGRSLLEYAETQGVADVYMGVETFAAPDTTVWFILGPTRQRYAEMLDDELAPLSSQSRFQGLRLRTLDDGEAVHLGIELPSEDSDRQRAANAASARVLAVALASRSPQRLPGNWEESLEHAQRVVQRSPELTSFGRRDVILTDTHEKYPGFTVRSRMLRKITFAQYSLQHFQTQVEAAEDYFRRYRRYRGTAIHYFDSFRQLADPRVGSSE